MGMPIQPPMVPQSLGAQPSPEAQHLGDVIKQFISNKQDQGSNQGLAEQILAQRFQPTFSDTSRSVFQSNQNGSYVSPEEVAAKRGMLEMTPYTAMADLQGKYSDNSLKQAQAGYYNSALSRDLAEKKYEYENNPALAMQRAMANYMTGMGGQGLPSAMPQPGNGQVQSGQPQFNPMGAMLAKQFGLENMQIGANGQPEMIPGVVSPGQKEQDTNFAQAYSTYTNTGGEKRAQNSLDIVNKTIDALKSGAITTGSPLDRTAMSPNGEPTWAGQLFDPSVLVTRNQISSAILPQAKPLFGARVTNFDAQSLINSQGLDPMADTQTNIAKLERLKDALVAGMQDMRDSGTYFQQHGTLAGYQPQLASPAINSGFNEGQTATNPQTGEKIIYKNGQWVSQ